MHYSAPKYFLQIDLQINTLHPAHEIPPQAGLPKIRLVDISLLSQLSLLYEN